MNKKTLISGLLMLTIAIPTWLMYAPQAKAAQVGFPDLRKHDFNDRVSSLIVSSGSVTLYDDINYGGGSITYTTMFHADLRNDGWSDRASSLRVDGTVIFYDDIQYGGRRITFTSNSIPYANLGTEWNLNPSLVKSQGKWDCRVWYWSAGAWSGYGDRLTCRAPDSDNYMNWASDGLVQGKAHDHSDSAEYWRAVECAQGFERSTKSIPNLLKYSLDSIHGIPPWNDRVSSLIVSSGSVTLYDDINYGGGSITYTTPFHANLGNDSWNDRASSLKISNDGEVTLYENINYGGNYLNFPCRASYQPLPLLKVSDKSSITLEGIVKDWDCPWLAAPNFAGVKFDVWVVENKETGKKLMMELYFIRAGGDLQWWWITRQPPNVEVTEAFEDPAAGSDTRNYLGAMDMFWGYASRTAYQGDIVKWNIDIKGLVQKCCNHWSDLNINNLYIAKIAFTIEAGYLLNVGAPVCYCSCTRLRLASQS